MRRTGAATNLRSSKELRKLLHRQPRFPNWIPKSALGELVVMGNRQPPVRCVRMPKNDMAAVLLVYSIANFRNALTA